MSSGSSPRWTVASMLPSKPRIGVASYGLSFGSPAESAGGGLVDCDERRVDVDQSEPRQRVVTEPRRGARVLRREVVCRALQDLHDLVVRQRGVRREQQGGRCAHVRRRERRALDRAVRGDHLALRGVLRQPGDRGIARHGGQDLDAGSSEVVVDRVTVRESRRVQVRADRRDAEHVGQRRRVARVGVRTEAVGVPGGGDDDGALPVRVVDRVLLGARVLVGARAGRAAATEREVDHPRAGVDGLLDAPGLLARIDRAVAADDTDVDDAHRLVEAGDPDAVVCARGDDAGDRGAVHERRRAVRHVDRLRRNDGRAIGTDEIRAPGIDSAVDHRHGHGIARELGDLGPEVERAHLSRVPLRCGLGIRRDPRERAASRRTEPPGLRRGRLVDRVAGEVDAVRAVGKVRPRRGRNGPSRRSMRGRSTSSRRSPRAGARRCASGGADRAARESRAPRDGARARMATETRTAGVAVRPWESR